LDKKYKLERMSCFAGVRFDLVQAGGGNSSVKLDEEKMLVKASGINLTQVTQNNGYVAVDYKKTREWFNKNNLSGLNKKERERQGKELLATVSRDEQGKPSIETFLHALLNTYTLHTHPVSVNTIASQSDWKEAFLSCFPDSVCVAYETPGIDLALSLYEEISEKKILPRIVFLQNHGLIVSSDSYREVIELTNSVTDKLNLLLGFDLKRYRDVTALQNHCESQWGFLPMIYCSDDSVVSELIQSESRDQGIWPFCPDVLVYCGVSPVFTSSVENISPLNDYYKKYSAYPNVVVINKQVYFFARSLKKAKESEELLKFHLLTISKNTSPALRLSLHEIAYLSNWDAEKYRQGI